MKKIFYHFQFLYSNINNDNDLDFVVMNDLGFPKMYFIFGDRKYNFILKLLITLNKAHNYLNEKK